MILLPFRDWPSSPRTSFTPDGIQFPQFQLPELQPVLPQVSKSTKNAMRRLSQLRSLISSLSKDTHSLERDVAYLDSRIALLIQNRLEVDEKEAKKIANVIDLNDVPEIKFSHEKLEEYGRLFYVLQNDIEIVSTLCFHISLSQLDNVVHIVLFTLYGNQYDQREERLLLNLFRKLLGHQFANAIDQGSLLRANTPISRMSTTYNLRGPGKGYLHSILAPKIQWITTDYEMDLDISPLRILNSLNLNIKCDDDATAATIPQVQEVLKPRICYLTHLGNSLVNQIVESLDQVPLGIRCICKMIWTLTKDYFPTAPPSLASSLIGSYFLLRFINPAIVSPHTFQLLPKAPSNCVRKTLTLLAKMLQMLATASPGSTQSQIITMRPFQKWAQNNSVLMGKFFQDLTKVDDSFINDLDYSTDNVRVSITPNELFSTQSLLFSFKNEFPIEIINLLQNLGSVPEQLPRIQNKMFNLKLIPPETTKKERRNISESIAFFNRSVSFGSPEPKKRCSVPLISQKNTGFGRKSVAVVPEQVYATHFDKLFRETDNLEWVYKGLVERHSFLQSQLSDYRCYLQNVRLKVSASKSRNVEKQFSHRQLEREKVISSSSFTIFRQNQVSMRISSPSAGTFHLALRANCKESLSEIEICIDDLLEKQKNNVLEMDLDYVKVNVVALTNLLKKNFMR